MKEREWEREEEQKRRHQEAALEAAGVGALPCYRVTFEETRRSGRMGGSLQKLARKCVEKASGGLNLGLRR